MLEAVFSGLVQVLQWKAFSLMLVGIGTGFCVGLLPGLGGGTTLALMLAFIYPMEPVEAFAFLLGMHSVTSTTGDITSVLFGVPGEGSAAATILDGHAMAKKGEAGRALGAALMSSLVGALIGALTLAVSVPIVRPLVLTFGAPELFMFALLGISCVSSVSGQGLRPQLRGLAAGALGLLLATVGRDPQMGGLRYDFGLTYLWGGLDLIPVLVGIFSIPEIVDLAVSKRSIAGTAASQNLGPGVFEGIKDTFRHLGVTLRCSAIGVWVGILPGLGGAAGQWMAYAHAVQSVRNPEERKLFGKGDVRGVLGPGAANNSKEGGDLIPTIAFGVPGSSSMAILLGALMMKGLVPGPDMLTKHLDLTFSMVWTLVVANVITVVLALLFLNHLVKLTHIRAGVLVPIILLLVYIGSYTANNHLGDLVVTVLFGVVGYFMVLYEWPRAPFVLGLVLGKTAETYYYISVTRYGFDWLMRPWVIVQILLITLIVVYPYVRAKKADVA
jgi:TctA family transporter